MGNRLTRTKAEAKWLAVLSMATAMGFASATVQASIWTGGNGNWSSTVSPGWTTGGVPDAVGAVADFSGDTVGAATVDAPRTVGTLSLSAGSVVRTITMSNGITFNNSGAGAVLSNTSASVSTNRLSIGSGTITLADNLLVSNTSGSTNTSGAITFSGILAGTGNVTVSNVSNTLGSGGIAFSGTGHTFTGTVLIEKGAVSFNKLGNTANAVTLGSAGNSATLVTTGTATTIANAITVAATVGTNVLGSTNVGTVNTHISVYSGTLLLNDNVSLTSVKAAGLGIDVRYTGIISGVGSVTTIGTGETQFGDGTAALVNTYTGDTTLTETSSLVLADNAELTFVIGASGVNNQITAVGGNNNVLTLDGNFNFDLSGAASVGSWNIVDVASLVETFSSTFTVNGFTESANVWTLVSGPTTYTFTEATGVLAAIPEPASLGLTMAFGAVSLLAARRPKRRLGSV